MHTPKKQTTFFALAVGVALFSAVLSPGIVDLVEPAVDILDNVAAATTALRLTVTGMSVPHLLTYGIVGVARKECPDFQ